MFSSELGTWMGKDLKIRPQSWGGNGATGGKFSFAKPWSSTIGLIGKGLSVYSMNSSYNKWQAGQIDTKLFAGDMVSGLAGIFGGIYGAAWSIGWSLGTNDWNAPKPQESVMLDYMREHGMLNP